MHTRVQKRLLAQPGLKRFVIELRRFLEDFRVRLEAHVGTRAVRRAAVLELANGFAAFKPLKPDFAVLIDFDFKPLGKRVHDGSADAVQATGNFISAAAEFAARVQDGEHHGHGRDADLVVNADGDTAAVVRHADDTVGQNLYVNLVAVTGEGFVDGIVYDFIDEVMKSARTCRADVHTRPFAYRFQPFENLYFTFIVGVVRLCHFAEFQCQTLHKRGLFSTETPAPSKHFCHAAA